MSVFVGETPLKQGNVAVIPIEGVITTGADAGLLPGKAVESQKVVDRIKDAEENEDIKALVFEINSPGGTPVATYEIAQAIRAVKKPTIAVIREVGASGGYWVATAAQEVWANELSITGSIGVLSSHLEFAGLLKDYNVTYRRLVAGKYKDAGSPWKEMSGEEQKLFEVLLSKLHDSFITAVAQNRNLPKEKVKELATGFVFLGSEAKEYGLVDYLGSKKDAIAALEKKLNITADLVVYKEKPAFFDLFSASLQQPLAALGNGIGVGLIRTQSSVLPMI